MYNHMQNLYWLGMKSFVSFFHFFLIIGRPGEKGKNTGLENLQREIAILKKVDHPNVVSLYEVH